MKKLRTCILSIVALLLFSSCGDVVPSVSKKPRIDPNLPIMSEIKHKSEMTSIALEWEPLKDVPDIEGYRIYRRSGNDESNKLLEVEKISDKYDSHYVDTKLLPGNIYFYAISSFTKDGTESKAGLAYKATTLPLIKPIDYIIKIPNLPKRAKLLWRPHSSLRVAGYIIEKNSASNFEWRQIAKVKNRLSSEFIDKKLKDDSIYRYRVRAYTFDNAVSPPSKVVEVHTKPLPFEVDGITATKDLPRKIELNWIASKNKDIDYYKIYRSGSGISFFKDYKKSYKNRFVDIVKEDGGIYFYKISAVDKDGLESPYQNSLVSGKTLEKPKTPTIDSTKIDKNRFFISWKASDNRTVDYKIIKTSKKGFYGKTIQPIVNFKDKTSYEDFLEPDVKYYYQIIGLDKFGIESNPTEEIEAFIK